VGQKVPVSLVEVEAVLCVGEINGLA